MYACLLKIRWTNTGGLLLVNVAEGGGVNEEFTDAASLAAFTGTGTIDYGIVFSTSVQQTGGDIGFFDFAPNMTLSGGLNVTYFFNPVSASVPEPSSFGLLSMAG